MKQALTRSHDKALIAELKGDPEFALEYLREAMEDTVEPRVLLVALRQVAEARGGLAKVAKSAGIQRESLYRILSGKGNPRFDTLLAVLRAVGLQLDLNAVQKQSTKRKAS